MKILRLFSLVICAMICANSYAGKYKNFKVSTYIRSYDIVKMKDQKFLEETWEVVSKQVDLDKIY
ncbi:MAG: hypothetical protein MJZ73_09795 [Bacteroidaceae bacterium]|nr:hypothetical protein [Bacteroidaceae bacterium]